MKFVAAQLAFGAATIVAPFSLHAAEKGAAPEVPIPAHELNFTPAFAGNPRELTLLTGPNLLSTPPQTNTTIGNVNFRFVRASIQAPHAANPSPAPGPSELRSNPETSGSDTLTWRPANLHAIPTPSGSTLTPSVPADANRPSGTPKFLPSEPLGAPSPAVPDRFDKALAPLPTSILPEKK